MLAWLVNICQVQALAPVEQLTSVTHPTPLLPHHLAYNSTNFIITSPLTAHHHLQLDPPSDRRFRCHDHESNTSFNLLSIPDLPLLRLRNLVSLYWSPGFEIATCPSQQLPSYPYWSPVWASKSLHVRALFPYWSPVWASKSLHVQLCIPTGLRCELRNRSSLLFLLVSGWGVICFFQ